MKNKILDRREFIASGVGGAVKLAMFPGLLSAVPAWSAGPRAPRFFVQIVMDEGWDVLVGLDPKLESETRKIAGDPRPDFNPPHRGYGDSDVMTVAGIRLGPCARALKPFAADSTVINGIDMSRLQGHFEAQAYIMSGLYSAGTEPVQLPFQISSLLRVEQPIGVLTNHSGARPGPVRIRTFESLTRGLSQGATLSSLYLDAGRDTVPAEFSESIDEMRTLERKMSALNLAEADKNDEMDTLARILSFAFKEGLARSAQYLLDSNLDTHADHDSNHFPAQRKAWEKVAALMSRLKRVPAGGGQSLYDQTVFMVCSEFSRTASLNPANGKDHNPYTNSVLVTGPGFRTGETIGQSYFTHETTDNGGPVHAAMGFDPRARRPVSADLETVDTRITPADVARTIVESFGNVRDDVFVNLAHANNLLGRAKP